MKNKVELKKSAVKAIAKLPLKEQQKIVAFLDNLQYIPNPTQLPNCKILLGHRDICRYRLGNYRVICHIQGNGILTILVLAVGNRKDIYRGW